MKSILITLEKLEQQKTLPNLAGIYAHFATMYFLKSEYEEVSTFYMKLN